MTNYFYEFAHAMSECSDLARQVVEETHSCDTSKTKGLLEDTWYNSDIQQDKKLSQIFGIISQQTDSLTHTQSTFLHSYNQYKNSFKTMTWKNQ